MTTKIQELTTYIRDNPEYYFKNVLDVTFWDKQKEIVESLKVNVKTAVRSCNSAGKTYSIARIAHWFLSAYPHSVVINTAPTHRQVENQFWREFRRAHKQAARPMGGKLLKTRFEIDEDWFAIGFSPRDGEGAMETFQGWHAENILFIVDEASGVHPSIFEAIEGGLAGGGVCRLVMIGNPTRNTGDFADAFKDPQVNKIHISAYDTPNVKQGKVIIPGLATKPWIESMISKYGEDSDIVQVRVFGNFPKKESDALISVDRVSKAINAERERYGSAKVAGLDVARFGNDRSSLVKRTGNAASVVKIWQKTDLMSLAGEVKRWMLSNPEYDLHIDITGGIGAGVFDRLKEQDDVGDRVFGVSVSNSATDKDNYANLRAEGWDECNAWLRDAILEDEDGNNYVDEFYELAHPKYRYKSNGQLLLESKDDMKKRGVKSPDVGDALVLTLQRPTEGGALLPLHL